MSMLRSALLLTIVAGLGSALPHTSSAQTPPAQAPAAPATPTRGIVRITGELYRAQNNNHYTVFLVTPDGIILSDPINRDFSRWLKAEMAARFKVPVRYVLYTHHHWDHASGGVVWGDTAEFVGHRNMVESLALPAGVHPLTGVSLKMDVNQNGVVEKSEATPDMAQRFWLFDENRDGLLSGAEMVRGPLSDVYPPDVTFADRHTVTLGGKRVVMVYVGNAHAPDSTILYFPDERAIFCVDILQIKRLPVGLTPAVGDMIDAMKTLLSFDFEHALTGHSLAGKKADAEDVLRYLQDLSTGVAAGIAAGQTLPEIQKSLTLDAYKGFDRYDLRADHIAQVYRTVKGSK